MDRLLELNPRLRKHMPRKRSGEPILCEKPTKIQKLTNKVVEFNNDDPEKPNILFQLQDLMLALEQKDNERVLNLAQALIDRPNLPPNVAMILLRISVHLDSLKIVCQLISNHKINLNTIEAAENVLDAIAAGKNGIALTLMRYGSDGKSTNDTLLRAVLRSHKIKTDDEREDLVKVILEFGADVNACDSSGYSLLHDAIVNNHCSIQLVEELLQRGAKLTINKSCTDLNDIYLATLHKPLLLPRLIQHQVPDEETKNQRGIMAIDYLISQEHVGGKAIGAMQMVKKILDLGVPVNTVDPLAEERVGQRQCPLLSIALLHKKKIAIKLLLAYGADPQQKDDLGRTPLYQATTFKNHTEVSRWLIEKGADINSRNDDGRYPIHGACLSESLSNLHLFLNLDADLNVTDNEGCTPFSFTQESFNFNEAHYLVIKHLALIIAKGGSINHEDQIKIDQYRWTKRHFKSCTKQLEKMKVKKICQDVPYFSLFSSSMYSMMKLMKNRVFVKKFEGSGEKRVDLFPEYFYMLSHTFELAKKRYKKLLKEQKKIHEVFGTCMPGHIVEDIAYYSCYEKLKRCQLDYYISLHASLKDTKDDKAKIL